MRITTVLPAALALALAVPAVASADTTLGTVTAPAGSTANACTSAYTGQILVSSLPAVGATLSGPYVVPSSSSQQALTQWSINASGATAGAQAELVVLSVNLAAGQINVVGTDTETLSTTGLPADGVETFTLTSPIAVQAGEVIGVYFPGSASPGITCDWGDPSTIQEDTTGLVVTSAPTTGETITPGSSPGASDDNSLLNLGATLAPLSYDAGVSLSSGPANAVVGQPAVLTATISNHGPLGGPITFTDPVPSGLTVQSASVGSGGCTVSAGVNIVTCTSGSVAVGQSTPVVIVVKPTAAQSYQDAGTVSLPGGGTDPNSANNTASTTLTVSKVPAAPKCLVPKLAGEPLTLAKQLLPLLDCKVGKVKKATSRAVAKGDVISTAPGAGSYAVGKSVGITVSSGKPKPKPKPKKKKKK
jgi:uncharacterized repeat protein (TIGR01451 family)